MFSRSRQHPGVQQLLDQLVNSTHQAGYGHVVRAWLGGELGSSATHALSSQDAHQARPPSSSFSPVRSNSTSSTPPLAMDQAALASQGTSLPLAEYQSKGRLRPSLLPIQHPEQRLKTAYIPWVFSRHQTPQRHVANRMGFLMEALEREQVQHSLASKQIDDFRSGDILEVRMLVPEAGRAEYIFKGLCIARYNKGIRTAFKLYNVYPESGGIVQHIPLHMPDLLSVKVVGRIPHARRNKLYYLLEGDKGASYQTQPQAANAANAGATKDAKGGKGGGKGKQAKK